MLSGFSLLSAYVLSSGICYCCFDKCHLIKIVYCISHRSTKAAKSQQTASITLSHIHIESNCVLLLCFSKRKTTINSRISQQYPIFSSIKVVKISLLSCGIVSTHQLRIETALLPHLIVVLCIFGDGICYKVIYHLI